MSIKAEALIRRAHARLRWLKRAALAYLVLCAVVLINGLATPGRTWPLLIGVAFAVALVLSSVWLLSQEVLLLEKSVKRSDELNQRGGRSHGP